MKPCYGLCERCVWKYNGGCSEWNKYVKRNHCFHCPYFDNQLKCTYQSNKYNCIAEEENDK